MDNKQLIHVACEGLLIGGISLYFSKQMKQMKKEVEELKAAVSKNQGANEKRFEVILNFLDNINGGFMPPQQPQQTQKVQPSLKQVPKKSILKKAEPLPKKTVVKKVEIKAAEEDEDELKEIEEERKMLFQEEEDSKECNEESCDIEEHEEESLEESLEEEI